LIELLVVIGIIAVLASLLLPALQGAKDKALEIQCIGNVHQVLIALRGYADDHEHGYPWVSCTAQSYMSYDWLQCLAEDGYTSGNYDVFQCPVPPKNCGYGSYVTTWDPNAGSGVPNSERLKGWYFYMARAKGLPRINAATAGYNTVCHQGWWGPVQVLYYLAAVNITQTDANWEKVPDSNWQQAAPIVCCPGVRGMPAIEEGAFCYPQGSWTIINPHTQLSSTNYGQTDGAVVRVRYPLGNYTNVVGRYEQIWNEFWGPRYQ